MKLTVSAGQNTFAAELPEPECTVQFRMIVQDLIKAEINQNNVTHEPVEVPTPSAKEEPATFIQEHEQTSHKGFMHIQCPNCGDIRSFNARTNISSYFCTSCRKTSDLPSELIPLFVACECGRRFRYGTNISDSMFDIPCLDCGNPVAVQLNNKTGCFETIRRYAKGAKKG